MRLVVNSIEKSLIALSASNENLENDLLNVYYEYNSLADTWKDGYSSVFFNNVESVKSTVLSVTEEISDLEKVYDLLVDTYKEYGNDIEVDIDSSSTIKSRYDRVLNSFKNISNQYARLDTSFCPYEAKFLANEKKYIAASKNRVEALKDKTVAFLNLVDSTEKEVKIRLGKLSIAPFKAYSYGATTNSKEATMDIDEFEKSLIKFNIYKNEVAKDASEINGILDELAGYYDGKNSSLVNTLKGEITRKLNAIVDVESTDASFLDRRKNIYLNNARNTSKQFKEVTDLQ